MNIDALLGRVVTQILMEPEERTMQFVCEGGDKLTFVTDADCCSETWFADIVGVNVLIGEIILLAQEVELPAVVDGRTRQEEDDFYGFRIFTWKGCCDVIYRNSSNGYYGGNCTLYVNGKANASWGGEVELGSLIDTAEWTSIVGDWSAT